MDLALLKDFKIKEAAIVSVGVQTFNLLNHPNFDQPVADINNPLIGMINRLVGPPGVVRGRQQLAAVYRGKQHLRF